MLESPAKTTMRAQQITGALASLYPDSHCALQHQGPWQLLVATILSAQCTDARVNLVTPALFKRYPDSQAMALAEAAELEKFVQSTGFFRNKTKNLQACCQALVERHGGAVPSTLEELVLLPGVGRKTANVVLGTSFGIPGITVDTHVGRLSRRLGLSRLTDPVKVEHDLMALLPASDWTITCLRLIDHGRTVCDARKPRCEACALSPLCPKTGLA